MLLLRFGRRLQFLDDSNVVVENGSDHGNNVGLDNPCPHVLGPTDADIDDALKG
jgi:hypothetical protein